MSRLNEIAFNMQYTIMLTAHPPAAGLFSGRSQKAILSATLCYRVSTPRRNIIKRQPRLKSSPAFEINAVRGESLERCRGSFDVLTWMSRKGVRIVIVGVELLYGTGGLCFTFLLILEGSSRNSWNLVFCLLLSWLISCFYKLFCIRYLEVL